MSVSFFDALLGKTDAADTARTGYTAAQDAAVPYIRQGQKDLRTAYGAAVSPYSDLLTYATPGTDAYARLVGTAPGSSPDTISQELGKLPGFQFTVDRANLAADRGGAARGLGTSGNIINAEQQNAANIADQYYMNYAKLLEPYLNLRGNAATGIAGVQQNLGNQLLGSQGTLANLAYNTQAGITNAQIAADQASAAAQRDLFGQSVKLATAGIGAAGGVPGISNLFSSGGGGYGTPAYYGGAGVNPDSPAGRSAYGASIQPYTYG